MVQFDNRQWQAKIKIVYYGPAVGGKTTCLREIHRVTDPDRRTKLYCLNTTSDRTLFFDLMSVQLGRIRGYELVVQLYTVPGQVQYQATRKAVLAGADGVVFVADSQVDRAQDNLESLQDLVANLRSHGMDPETIPLVYQYNKRDLDPLISIEDLETLLNPKKRPAFQTVATTGIGVLEGFAEICYATVMSVADRLGVAQNRKAIARLSEQVHQSLKPLLAGREVEDASQDIVINRPTTPAKPGAEEAPLSHEALVDEAVQANVAMTDMSATLDLLNRRLQRQLRRLFSLHELLRKLSMEQDAKNILKMVMKSTIQQLEVVGASIALFSGQEGLKPILLHGFPKDPLLSDRRGTRQAKELMTELKPFLFQVGGMKEDSDLEALLTEASFGSAIWVPLIAYGRPLGLLGAYAGSDRSPLEAEDLELASILASSASIAYLNVRSRRKLEKLSS